MLRKLILSLMLISVLSVPATSYAMTQDSLLEQIQGLLRMVSSLQEQLRAVEGDSTAVSDFTSCASAGNPVMESYPRQCAHNGKTYTEIIPNVQNTTPSYCHSFAKSLSLGAKGTDVTALQEFLRSTGTYTYPTITGYFGNATQQAVQKWQSQNGVVSAGTPNTTGYGAVGPATRRALKSVCENKTEPVACTMQYDPVCGATSSYCTNGECVQGVTKTYGNSCQLKASSAKLLYTGECRANQDDPVVVEPQDPKVAPNNCRVWNDGCNTCARTYEGGPLSCTKRMCFWEGVSKCEVYFEGEKPVVEKPRASLLAFPSSGNAPLTVKFSGLVKSDGYSIDYGDGTTSGDVGCAHGGCSIDPKTQKVSNEHTYKTAGTYKAKLRMHFASNAGNCAGVDCNVVATKTVTVRGEIIPPSNTQFSVSSTSGSAPFTVSFTAPGGYSCGDGPDYKIDFGDGESKMTPSCTIGLQKVSHTYNQGGKYTATLYQIPSGFGPVGQVNTTPRAVGSLNVSVQGGTAVCNTQYAPVCGIRPWVCEAIAPAVCGLPSLDSLKTTYSNVCKMNNAGATLLHQGACNTN